MEPDTPLEVGGALFDDAEPAADPVSTELRDILGNTHDVETYRELIEALIFMERHK